jgi:hypothetical protein
MLAPARTLDGTDGLKRLTVATTDRPLRLDSGRTLEHVEIAYETWGTLNADKSNVVVVCHALTGDQFASSPNPGHRPSGLVGPHRRAGHAGGYRPLLRDLLECAGRLHGLDRPGLQEAGRLLLGH